MTMTTPRPLSSSIIDQQPDAGDWKTSTKQPTARMTTAAAASYRARMSRAVALYVLVLALPLARQWLLHSQLPDTLPPSSALFGEPQSGVLTIGVVVTVTGCGAFFPIDGAAVLRHSFLRHSSERYRYQFYAIYHPMAASCVKPLADVGYVLLERETPVNISEIQGDYLRGRIAKSGCCGEKELIKFEAFLLTQHPVVILLDMDMIVLKPLDEVIDIVLYNNRDPDTASHHLQRSSPQRNNTASGDVWLLWVGDYHMALPYADIIPTQGGFAIFKPNRTLYNEFVSIVRKGDFDESMGWGNATGIFWGSTTWQGLISYHRILHPGHALELDWRLYDNMNSPKSDMLTRNGETFEYCFTFDCQSTGGPWLHDLHDGFEDDNVLPRHELVVQEDQVQILKDPRLTPFEDIYTAHFTNCQKPWMCQANTGNNINTALCRAFHRSWYQYRSELEKSWGRSGRGSYNGTSEYLLGYCSKHGEAGYDPIREPYGVPA